MNEIKDRRAVVLAADYQYINKITTTVKSIMYNCPEVRIYIMNSDIPQEWFSAVNEKVNPIGDRVVDVKIDPELLNSVHVSKDYVSPISFAYLFSFELIPNEDYLVYLDSDIVIDSPIEGLLNYRFTGQNLLAAALDVFNMDDYYNAGVVVINNQKLREIPDLKERIMETAKGDLKDGDQSVINDLFNGRIGKLPEKYNYQVGAERVATYAQVGNVVSAINAVNDPIFYHFMTDDKPWNFTSSGRDREKWWKYCGMDWAEIVAHQHNTESAIKPRQSKGTLFTFTNSQDLECFEDLVKKLPDFDFAVAAWTPVGWELKKLLKYPNVHLYPIVTDFRIRRLIGESKAYLDINYGGKDNEVIKRFANGSRCPILTYDDVSSNIDDFSERYITFKSQDVNGMATKIKELSWSLW